MNFSAKTFRMREQFLGPLLIMVHGTHFDAAAFSFTLLRLNSLEKKILFRLNELWPLGPFNNYKEILNKNWFKNLHKNVIVPLLESFAFFGNTLRIQ